MDFEQLRYNQMIEKKAIHEFRDSRTGQRRRALVLHADSGGYNIHCFADNVFQGVRTITGHSEQYAEEAAENYVIGLYDRP